jgi:hypothetical protein
VSDVPWHICDRHGFSTPLEELEECPDCYLRPDIRKSLAQERVQERTAALERQHLHHHRDLRDKIRYLEPDVPPPLSGAGLLSAVTANKTVPAGWPDYVGLQPLVEVTITPGLEITYDGRPAVVCVPPSSDHLGPKIGEYVLIRYLDGKRERILANPYDCAVGTDL